MNSVTQKWAATGLLQGLYTESADKLASNLDELANLVRNTQTVDDHTMLFSYTLFPVARLLAEKECFPEPKSFYTEFKEWLSKNSSPSLTPDEEVDLCRRFADEYVVKVQSGA